MNSKTIQKRFKNFNFLYSSIFFIFIFYIYSKILKYFKIINMQNKLLYIVMAHAHAYIKFIFSDQRKAIFPPHFTSFTKRFVYLNLKLPNASLGFILDLYTKVSILRATTRVSLSPQTALLLFPSLFDRSTHSA